MRDLTDLDWSSVVSTAVIFGAGVIAGVFLGRRRSGARALDQVIQNSLESRKFRLATIRLSNPLLSRTHKMILVVRNDLGMGKGKIAAQSAHAAVLCYQKAQITHQKDLDIWEATGCTKVCVKTDEGEEGLLKLQQEAKERNFVYALVRDAGHTQVDPGTVTVLGLGPAPAEALAEITSRFKLL